MRRLPFQFLLLAGFVLTSGCQAAPDTVTSATAAMPGEATTSTIQTRPMPACADLPTGSLSDADLVGLVPDDSPGRVRVGWKTESQEETYGFNILRADGADGPYRAINPSIIPGEGTTNIPKSYCFEDTSVTRGNTYFYQIEEITNDGAKSIVDGTAATKAKVKTVEEERLWLRKKAADATTTSPR